jgi:DNA-binding NarL/FixJ family response regulator
MTESPVRSNEDEVSMSRVADLLAGTVGEQLVNGYVALLGRGDSSEPDAVEVIGSLAGLQELIREGLANRTIHGGQVLIRPTDPSLSFRRVLERLQAQLIGSSSRLIEAHQQVDVLQRAFARRMLDLNSDEAVKRITAGEEIQSLSLSMVNGAQSDYMELHTWRFSVPLRKEEAGAPPAPVIERGVRRRSIYSTEYFDTEVGHHFIQNAMSYGTEVRIYRNLRMKMKLIDEEAALVPLTPSGASGVLYVRSPIIVGALRQYYELLWARATPLAGSGPAQSTLSDVHRQLVQLMALGLKDESIANRTGLSLRTVRRHIATIMELLSAETRFAAGVAAAKRGLLD